MTFHTRPVDDYGSFEPDPTQHSLRQESWPRFQRTPSGSLVKTESFWDRLPVRSVAIVVIFAMVGLFAVLARESIAGENANRIVSTEDENPQSEFLRALDHHHGCFLEIGSSASRATVYQWGLATSDSPSPKVFESPIGVAHVLVKGTNPPASSSSTQGFNYSQYIPAGIPTGTDSNGKNGGAQSQPQGGSWPFIPAGTVPGHSKPTEPATKEPAAQIHVNQTQIREDIKGLLLPFLKGVHSADEKAQGIYGDFHIKSQQFQELTNETKRSMIQGVHDAFQEAGFNVSSTWAFVRESSLKLEAKKKSLTPKEMNQAIKNRAKAAAKDLKERSKARAKEIKNEPDTSPKQKGEEIREQAHDYAKEAKQQGKDLAQQMREMGQSIKDQARGTDSAKMAMAGKLGDHDAPKDELTPKEKGEEIKREALEAAREAREQGKALAAEMKRQGQEIKEDALKRADEARKEAKNE